MSELNIDLDNVEDIKDIPTGWYSGVIADATVGKSKSEEPKPFAKFRFRAQEALENQDLTGVELNRMIDSTDQWLSPKALPIFKKRMADAGFTPSGDLSAWLKGLHLQPVHFKVGYDSYTNKAGQKVDRLRVVEFKAA
jgi:hypothetical protein